jgi:hypothetical protein
MSGTVHMLAPICHRILSHPALHAIPGECSREGHVLRMSVRTEDTRLISRAFTLPSSRPPKPGSDADAVQPTVRAMSARSSRRRVSNVGI